MSSFAFSLLCLLTLAFLASDYNAGRETRQLYDGDYIDSISSGNNDSREVVEELNKGKELYKQKCKTCHTLYKPRDFKLRVWKENLEEMRFKAGLTNNEYDLILNYLSKNCKK